MEDNVSDALKLAGSVLLFVFALSVCMLAFSNARESLDTILKFSDREFLTVKEGELAENYYYLSNISDNENSLSRTVGYESIIPTIYRSLDENFMVVFKDSETKFHTIYKMDGQDVPIISSYSAGSNRSIKFNGISLGESLERKDLNDILGNGIQKYKCQSVGNFREFIKNNIFKEELGIFYKEDLEEYEYQDTDGNSETSDNYGDLSEYNKTPVRIITYTKIKSL